METSTTSNGDRPNGCATRRNRHSRFRVALLGCWTAGFWLLAACSTAPAAVDNAGVATEIAEGEERAERAAELAALSAQADDLVDRLTAAATVEYSLREQIAQLEATIADREMELATIASRYESLTEILDEVLYVQGLFAGRTMLGSDHAFVEPEIRPERLPLTNGRRLPPTVSADAGPATPRSGAEVRDFAPGPDLITEPGADGRPRYVHRDFNFDAGTGLFLFVAQRADGVFSIFLAAQLRYPADEPAFELAALQLADLNGRTIRVGPVAEAHTFVLDDQRNELLVFELNDNLSDVLSMVLRGNAATAVFLGSPGNRLEHSIAPDEFEALITVLYSYLAARG